MSQNVTKDEYLDKGFDYSKLTKQELRQIMSELNVENIPPLSSLKSVILDTYKANVFDKIDQLKKDQTPENIFQSGSTSSKVVVEVEIPKKQSQDHLDDDFKNKYFNDTLSGDSSLVHVLKSSDEHKDKDVNLTSVSNKLSKRTNALGSCLNDVNESFKKAESSFRKENDSIISRKDSMANPKILINESLDSSILKSDNISYVDSVVIKNDPIDKEKSPIKPSTPKIQRARSNSSSNSKRHIFFNIIFVLIAAVCIYLKFFCPYCDGTNSKFCIPIPPNTTLIDGQLICDDGYQIIRGIINICIPDNSKERKLARKVRDIIKLLQYMKGDFKHGFATTDKVKLDLLTTDQNVIERLRTSGLTIISENGDIKATSYRTSFRIFMKYYSIVLIKLTVLIVVLFLFFKYLLNRRRKSQLLKTQAFSMSKEVLEILNRQVLMSTRSLQFKSFVTEDQLVDALEIKKELWPYVRNVLSKNSNVQLGMDENNKPTLKWVGPIIFKADPLE